MVKKGAENDKKNSVLTPFSHYEWRSLRNRSETCKQKQIVVGSHPSRRNDLGGFSIRPETQISGTIPTNRKEAAQKESKFFCVASRLCGISHDCFQLSPSDDTYVPPRYVVLNWIWTYNTKGNMSKWGGSHDLVSWSCGGYAERRFSQGFFDSVQTTPIPTKKLSPGKGILAGR